MKIVVFANSSDGTHVALVVQSQNVRRIDLLKRIAKCAFCLTLLAFAKFANAQVQVGDDLRMNLNGLLTAGYEANYGDQIPSNHGLNIGGSGTLNGSYYNPNFLNFTVSPYYNQSRADSSIQSLTNASGVNATANFFTGSHFPGYMTYDFTRNSTGTNGLIGSPNFTTVGDGQAFGVGWSALLPNWPTFSVNYSQGTGNGTVYGTNEESNSKTRTLNLRSSYQLAGWQLNGQYTYLNIKSSVPIFLTGESGNNFLDSSGNNIGINGIHSLPWRGSIALTFNHSTYSGDYGSTLDQNTGVTQYTTNIETANASFHPTTKLGLFVNQSYTDNLNGFLYQSIANGGGGVPLFQLDSTSHSSTLSAGTYYNFTPNLYAQAQITYFNQAYFGKTYDGSYFSGTVGYGKRILKTFTVSATVIESTNQFANNSLGFIGNLNAFHRIGLWELSGNLSYAQNVQTLLVTYTTSYYNYSANLHRRLGRGMQWTGAFNGNHTGFSQVQGTVNHSESFSTSLALRRAALNANYVQSNGQALLTSTGIQPLPPTPGLPPEGLIIYNGKGYGAGISLTPTSRLTISGDYSHTVSDTTTSATFSHNRTEIFYGQLQYRLRQLNLLAGYTRFSQGFSAAGVPPGTENSYFIGVSRYINFF
jgi:hypothetical protein